MSSPDEGGASVDLDKSWHGIHFVLTGNLEDDGSPLSGAILGGQPLGDGDFEEAIFLPPDQVRRTAEALAALDDADFAALHESRTWTDAVYGPNDYEYFLENFLEVAAFFEQAAARGNAVMKFFY
jgi:hypothetical protein